MDVFRPNLPPDGQAPVPDPRLQPTPDYGTLGPGSDLAKSPVSAQAQPAAFSRQPAANLRRAQIGAAILGAGIAIVVSTAGGPLALWGKVTGPFSSRKDSAVSSSRFRGSSSANRFSDRDLDHQQPQRQAEILLERAVSRSGGASNQIEARVESWRGKLQWDSQLGNLTTAALNSDDQGVRESAIEVQLAAYGLSKSEASADALVRRADSPDHAQKIWALWSLGLLANRGIETERVIQVLTAHVSGAGKDSDVDSRRWAVEALALVGTTPTIAPLLEVMRNDPSALVRERAACSLASSGMLSHEQRLIAVPQLINYSEDPALDAQTHAWAFQALGDITKQRLPNDSSAWRTWYQTAAASAP